MPRARAPFTIAEHEVRAGRRAQIELPIARLMSGTPVALPVIVLHGRADGPVIWLNAAVHGDELNGVEIIRRVLAQVSATTIAGTLIAVPIVNVHGFNNGDRYLPDRRDLNRSFPGSARGSLASRIAHLMMTEVGMIESAPPSAHLTVHARSSRWVRATNSGILHLEIELGDHIDAGSPIATIYDPFGKRRGRIASPIDGTVIGHTEHPLVNRGDAGAHIAAPEAQVQASKSSA